MASEQTTWNEAVHVMCLEHIAPMEELEAAAGDSQKLIAIIKAEVPSLRQKLQTVERAITGDTMGRLLHVKSSKNKVTPLSLEV